MSEEKKYSNSGILFTNEKKEKDSQPDRKGSANIDGVDYWIAGWIKTGNKGKFLTLSFDRKDEKTESKPVQNKQDRSSFDDMEDDIPFN